MYLILLLAFIPIAIFIGTIVGEMYSALASIQQEGTLLALGFTSISIMIFLFGIFYVLNIFYFANDIEALLPLPLKPSYILGAKLTTAIIYEYIVAAILFVPLVFSYGVKSGSGFLYYFYSLILYIALPVIPLLLASALVMVVMRFTNIAKNKDRMRIIGGIIAVVLALGGNFAIQFYANKPIDESELQHFFMQKNSLIEFVTNWFPTSKFPAQALVNWDSMVGLANITLFIGISLLLLIGFLMLGEAIYFKGVTGVSETTAKRKKINETDLAFGTRRSMPITALLKKEIRLLVRTPAYLMNCILSSLMLPLILILAFFLNPNGTSQLLALQTLFNGDPNMGLILSIVFAIAVFLSAANSIAATAISREGKHFFVSKYLPVSYIIQLWAKLFSAVIFSALTVVVTMVVIVAVLKPAVIVVLFSSVILMLGIVFSSLVGLLFDLHFPKLDWVNEQRAVKGNLNVVFSLLINIAIAGGLVFVFAQFDLGIWGGFMLLTGILFVLNAVLIQYLVRFGGNALHRIEE